MIDPLISLRNIPAFELFCKH